MESPRKVRSAEIPLVGRGEDKVELIMEVLALERLPFSLVEPDTTGHRTAVHAERQPLAHLVPVKQAAALRAEKGALGIVLKGRLVAIRKRSHASWTLLAPGEIGLQRNPVTFGNRALKGGEAFFDFTANEFSVGVERTAHGETVLV